jgi:hypothetical protein
MRLIAIDPGPIQSAFVEWDGKTPSAFGIHENNYILEILKDPENSSFDKMVIEEVQCYGMPVGKSIFETVFWSGRFCEACWCEYFRVPRKDVKMHLCHSMRAKDSNVIQALADRFAPFEKNKGKGTVKDKKFFFGFKKDIWQAFALGVAFWDQKDLK